MKEDDLPYPLVSFFAMICSSHRTDYPVYGKQQQSYIADAKNQSLSGWKNFANDSWVCFHCGCLSFPCFKHVLLLSWIDARQMGESLIMFITKLNNQSGNFPYTQTPSQVEIVKFTQLVEGYTCCPKIMSITVKLNECVERPALPASNGTTKAH